jgi:hypothetical protein
VELTVRLRDLVHSSVKSAPVIERFRSVGVHDHRRGHRLQSEYYIVGPQLGFG